MIYVGIKSNQAGIAYQIMQGMIEAKIGMIMLVLEGYNTRAKSNPISMIHKDLICFC